MATYYVSTSDGRIHQITGVTGVELVVNDGVATVMYDGVWRNTIPFPSTNNATSPLYGPGWVATPDATTPFHRVTSADAMIYHPIDAADTIQPDLFKDDILTETAPRFLEVKKSYWKFTATDGDFFFPAEMVVGMSNNLPTY